MAARVWTIEPDGKCESSASKNPTCRFGPSRERLRSPTLPPGDCSLSARSHQETEPSLSDDEPASSAIGPTGKSRWSCRAAAPLSFQKGEVRRSRLPSNTPMADIVARRIPIGLGCVSVPLFLDPQIVDYLNKGVSKRSWQRFSAVHPPHSTPGSGADAFPEDSDPRP